MLVGVVEPWFGWGEHVSPARNCGPAADWLLQTQARLVRRINSAEYRPGPGEEYEHILGNAPGTIIPQARRKPIAWEAPSIGPVVVL